MVETTITKKTPLWMRVTLFASLASNVLIVGVVVGLFLVGGPQRRPDGPRSDGNSLYTRSLAPEDRRAVRRHFVSGLEGQGRDRGGFIADIRTTLVTLRATPFDADAFVAALSKQSDSRAKRDRIGRQALAAQISAMSEEDRAAYADRIEQGLDNLSERVRRP